MNRRLHAGARRPLVAPSARAFVAAIVMGVSFLAAILGPGWVR